MTRFKIALAAAALLLAAPALAQTVTKAAPSSSLGSPYPTSRCGFYYGINAEAGAGVVPGAPSGTTVVGGDVGALVGYACPSSPLNWFAEAIFDFQNLNAGNNGFSMSGPAHLEQRAGFQTPLFSFLGSLGINTGTPQSVQPMLPPGVTVSGSTQNYIYGAINEDDISSQLGAATAHQWLISPEIGTGMLIPLSAGTHTIIADTYAGIELQSNSFCLGALACPKLGTRYKTGVSFKY